MVDVSEAKCGANHAIAGAQKEGEAGRSIDALAAYWNRRALFAPEFHFHLKLIAFVTFASIVMVALATVLAGWL